MSQTEKKQEEQAAAEERDEILEAANEDDNIDLSAVPTPEDSKTAGGTHIERSEEAAEAAAGQIKEDEEKPVDKKPAAKAGRRSAKAIREEEAEATRKATAKDKPESKSRPEQKPNLLKRHGKNYRSSLDTIDKTKHYELPEAVELAKKTAKVKFDPSVELHINLGVDPKQADQMVRATVALPHGTGKNLRVAVVAPTDKHDAAKKAGADIVSDGDLIDKIDKGQLDFDVLVATPDMMGRLSKAARVLGPRGLMPNPKSGTVTANVGQAVKEAKAGRVEFRIDKQAIVHLAIGKASFSPTNLEENLKAAIDAVMKAKPSATKGTYVKSMSMATSMGPGIKLDTQKAIAASNPKK